MKITRFIAASLAVMISGAVAYATQQYPAADDNSSIGSTIMQWLNGSNKGVPVSASNPLPVSGSFSATLNGFTPNGSYASLTSTAAGSVSTALPSGTVVDLVNTGTTAVSCTPAVGAATPAVNNLQVAPGGGHTPLVVGSFVNIACKNQAGDAANNVIVMAGGSGLANTSGGGGSSGSGGTVTQGNAGSNAQAWWAQIGDTARGPAKVQAGNSAATTDVALTVADPNLLAAVNAPPTLGSASGGLSIKTLAALGTTPVAVKASAGQVYKIQCYNPDASNSAAIELFNTASVTLGTTTVFDFIEIGPGQNSGSALSLVGTQYSTAITAAAVKTIGGSTAPTTAPDCTIYFN